MKLNIFRIPHSHRKALEAKLKARGLVATSKLAQGGWKGKFLFHPDPPLSEIPWVKTFARYIGSDDYGNKNHHAVLLLSKRASHFAITFGKSHFYVRPYCDYDFGIELAKRIANEADVTQTASRKYQGRRRKDIRSYAANSPLNIPPGSSVDFLQGAIIDEHTDTFGKRAKFGTSALLDVDIRIDDIGELLSAIKREFRKKPRFKLPRTLVLSDATEIAKYDEMLIDELMSPVGASSISTDTFDLFGVDFVFSSTGTYDIKCGHYKSKTTERLTIKEVKEYIEERRVPRGKVLSTRITHYREGEPHFSQPIKSALDYISDDDKVALQGGRWLKFNEDYLDALNDAIRSIAVEDTEPGLLETTLTEEAFNLSLANHGYTVADRNFQLLRVEGGPPVEAWDLQKGDTVYAVKFGTPQKLGYVVDQASNALELIHAHTGGQQLPSFDRYCLWFGYRAKGMPKSLADSGSIILKQKVEAWARKCEEVGKVPVLKLSRKLNASYDTPAS